MLPPETQEKTTESTEKKKKHVAHGKKFTCVTDIPERGKKMDLQFYLESK